MTSGVRAAAAFMNKINNFMNEGSAAAGRLNKFNSQLIIET